MGIQKLKYQYPKNIRFSLLFCNITKCVFFFDIQKLNAGSKNELSVSQNDFWIFKKWGISSKIGPHTDLGHIVYSEFVPILRYS